jgi:hypothetical protein
MLQQRAKREYLWNRRETLQQQLEGNMKMIAVITTL